MADYRFQPRRELGRTGFIATQLGIGDLADRSIPIDACIATARRALDAGLNLIDTAPYYEDGYSEQIVGRALRDAGTRDKVFVIDKVDELADPVMPQIDASLQRLQMDSVDLFVMHGLSKMDGPDGWRAASAPGGSMHQLGDAIKAGKCRYRGISCHHPDVLATAIPSGLVDVVMFPVGPFVDSRYITEILPLARKHHVGTVCFKTFGAGKLLGDTEGYQQPLSNRPRGKLSSGGTNDAITTLPRMTVEECLHYTLTIDPDVALLGMSFPNEQDAAFAAYHSLKAPLSEQRLEEIRAKARTAVKNKGSVWWNPA